MAQSEIQVQDHSAEFYEEVRYKRYGLKYHASIIAGMVGDLEGRILDVGCGTGIISRLYPQKDLTGIDISEGMLKYHPGKCMRASADEIPFPDASFDAVVGRSILHHLEQPEKSLAEMHRVLKPGGRLVLWETNKSWLSHWVRKIAQPKDRFAETHGSFSDLPTLVAKHFHLTQVTYQGYVAYPLFGFPDIRNFAKYMPLKSVIFPLTFRFDQLLGCLPLIRKLAFAVRIKAQKPT